MTTKKVKLYIQAEKSNLSEGSAIVINACEFRSDKWSTYITLNTIELDIEVPELDEKALTLAEIEQIRDKIKAEKADSYLRVVQMEEKINSLMCLESDLHTPAEVLSTLNTEVNE